MFKQSSNLNIRKISKTFVVKILFMISSVCEFKVDLKNKFFLDAKSQRRNKKQPHKTKQIERERKKRTI